MPARLRTTRARPDPTSAPTRQGRVPIRARSSPTRVTAPGGSSGRCAGERRQRQRRVGGALGGEHARPGDEHVAHVMAAAVRCRRPSRRGCVAHLRRADDVTRTEREVDVVAFGRRPVPRTTARGGSWLWPCRPAPYSVRSSKLNRGRGMPMASRKSNAGVCGCRGWAAAPSTSRSGSPITGRQIRTTRASSRHRSLTAEPTAPTVRRWRDG